MQVEIPDAESAQLKVTATSVLCHALTFGKGDMRPVMVGGVVSSTVTMKWSPETFPEASVAAQLTVVVPTGKVEPEEGSHSTTGLGSTESVAMLVKITSAPSLLLASVLKLAGRVSKGGVMSLTVTGKLPLLVFPASSVAVHTTRVVPKLNSESEEGLHVTTGSGSTISVATASNETLTPVGPVASTVMLPGSESWGGLSSFRWAWAELG